MRRVAIIHIPHGTVVEVTRDGEFVHSIFHWIHPADNLSPEEYRLWAEDLVRTSYGTDYIKDIDWGDADATDYHRSS